MSDSEQKLKHSKRIHQTENHINRQVKIAKSRNAPVEEPHKYAKRHAMDCGNPKCIFCANPRKTFGELTIQERRFLEEPLDD